MPKLKISRSRKNSKRGIPAVNIFELILSDEEAEFITKRLKNRDNTIEIHILDEEKKIFPVFIFKLKRESEIYGWLGKEKDEKG